MARLRAGGAAPSPARCQGRTSWRAMPMRCSSSFRVILRMGDGVVAAERRLARLVGPAGAAQQIPHLVIERQVEIGQDHRALRQAGDDPQQPRDRRRGAGDARPRRPGLRAAVCVQARAVRSSSWLRRVGASTSPRAASSACQCAQTFRKAALLRCQCAGLIADDANDVLSQQLRRRNALPPTGDPWSGRAARA